MSKGPLFSTYRQGENRVTASMLAVFERIDLSLVERLLQAATEESSLQMVRFENQVQGPRSVPDALISVNFRYYFEVKTARNTADEVQLRDHLTILDERGGDDRLFVLTPDDEIPAQVAEIDDDRVTWFNFRSLNDSINSLLTDPAEQVAERETLPAPRTPGAVRGRWSAEPAGGHGHRRCA